MRKRVGIPLALGAYEYLPLWQTFFEELGAEVLVSQATTKEILDRGIEDTVSDACVPIKVFQGHVAELADKVDFLFIPRLVNVIDNKVFCPKFLGLPEMVKFTMSGLPQIIDVRVDLRQGRLRFLQQCHRISRLFTDKVGTFLRAMRRSLQQLRRFRRLLAQGLTFWEARRRLGRRQTRFTHRRSAEEAADHQLRIAVLGYPYAVYDPYINANLLKKVRRQEATVLTADMLSWRRLLPYSGGLRKDMFWTFSDRALRAGYYYLAKGLVDGVIHVTAFGCGPDSMVDKLLDLASLQHSTPYMTLMIDEHTGDAGVMTRVEAFCDMVRRRKEAG